MDDVGACFGRFLSEWILYIKRAQWRKTSEKRERGKQTKEVDQERPRRLCLVLT